MLNATAPFSVRFVCNKKVNENLRYKMYNGKDVYQTTLIESFTIMSFYTERVGTICTLLTAG